MAAQPNDKHKILPCSRECALLRDCLTFDLLHIWVVVRVSLVSTLLVWGGDIMCTDQNLGVCLPYVHGRIRWISVCHLLVLSPSATGQLQMQRPCRWPLSMCECTAGLWSLFLVLETWRRNTTYLLVSTWKHLFLYTKHGPTRKHRVTCSYLKTLVFTH